MQLVRSLISYGKRRHHAAVFGSIPGLLLADMEERENRFRYHPIGRQRVGDGVTSDVQRLLVDAAPGAISTRSTSGHGWSRLAKRRGWVRGH